MTDEREADRPGGSAVPRGSLSGSTRSGMPLSLNREPAADLAPWIARIAVTRVDTASDFEVECALCNDIAWQRVILDGNWEDCTGPQPVSYSRGSILIGPHSQHFDTRCTGTIANVGVALRPGALHALFGRDTGTIVDRIERSDPLGLMGEGPDFGYPPDASAHEWADIAEERARKFIRDAAAQPPNPMSTAFEAASFANPNIKVGDFAKQQGVNRRTLERLVKRDFGLTPRTVLRRARTLDLAAQLLGIADEEEEAEFLLRYFDQAHLIREFQAFFGVTPAAFRAESHMLMTINLEVRSARRLEELKRLRPGDRRPWSDS
ncbi:MAG: helix-turn-helix transcriptional regulator [Erythrobacter sp.]